MATVEFPLTLFFDLYNVHASLYEENLSSSNGFNPGTSCRFLKEEISTHSVTFHKFALTLAFRLNMVRIEMLLLEELYSFVSDIVCNFLHQLCQIPHTMSEFTTYEYLYILLMMQTLARLRPKSSNDFAQVPLQFIKGTECLYQDFFEIYFLVVADRVE